MLKIKILSDPYAWKLEELFDEFMQNELGENNIIHEIKYTVNNIHDVYSIFILYSPPEYSQYQPGLKTITFN